MANTPKIRFKGFTDDWEQHKLGELTRIASAARVHKEDWTDAGVPFFRSSDVVAAYKRIDNEKAFITKELYGKLSAISGKLEKDDILITGGGSIGIPYIVPNNEPLYSKDADLIWIKHSHKFDSQYLYSYITAPVFRSYIGSISHIGTIAHYTIEQVKATPVVLPSIKEQEQIGRFFRFFDNLITLHQRKINETKELKKFMLQKMFPKKGEKIPEIRFSGFTDVWEQRKLGELASLITKGTTPLDKSNSGNVNFVKIESIDESTGEITITQKISSAEHNGYLRRSQLRENDILFSIAGTLGRVTSVKSSILPANTNQALAIIRLKRGYLEYVKTYLKGKAVSDFIKKNPTIGAQPNLSLEQVGNLEILLPSEDEQKRIGAFFKSLDNLITLHQRKCDELKDIKKVMLKNMFI